MSRTSTSKTKNNKYIRDHFPGGDSLLDCMEALHGRLKHLKAERRRAEAKLAEEILNDLNSVAEEMREAVGSEMEENKEYAYQEYANGNKDLCSLAKKYNMTEKKLSAYISHVEK